MIFVLLLLCWCPSPTTAFSSIGIPYNKNGRLVRDTNTADILPQEEQPQRHGDTAAATSTATAPWRLALDIGREPLSTMPFGWARSGCRLPIVVRCDVSSTNIQPQMDTISFTSADGAVVRPVLGGTLQLLDHHHHRSTGQDNKTNINNNQRKRLAFALTFPEAMARRDVTIDADTTLYCTGTYYTQSELDLLNQAYYAARNDVWVLDNELKAMTEFDGPAKRWNEETKQWERRTNSNSSPLAWAQKQLQYRAAQAKERQTREARPDPNSLSERGTIPGVDDAIYIVKEGVIRSSSAAGAIMGWWSMEPMMIPRRPASYYRH
jgi:hypothetical protein